MRLYIDNIIFYLQKSGGISVVWKEILVRLVRNYPNVALLDYKKQTSNIFYEQIRDEFNSLPLRLYALNVQRYLPVRLKENSKFIFHSTYYRYSSNSDAINITTVHDFTYEYFKSGLRKWLHCWQKYRAIRKSKYVICISENTKRDLLKFLPDYNETRIRVIYNGASDEYYPTDSILEETFPFEKYGYLLFVGDRDGYKNFNFLVESLEDTMYKLVIVGAPINQREQIFLDKYIMNRWFYAGRITNAELNNLYNAAYALVYPSSYEGFGIPVIEAQKAGCPVIAYNSSSIPEIIGETPLLLNNLTKDELLYKLSMLSHQEVRQQVIKNGFINAAKFNWERTFHDLMRLYEEAGFNVVE